MSASLSVLTNSLPPTPDVAGITLLKIMTETSSLDDNYRNHLSNLGVMYIGVSLSGILYGVSFAQTWYYYDRYNNDPWPLKILYLVTNFAKTQELDNFIWSLAAEVLFNGLIGLMVQSFFTYRIYQLSNRNILLTGIVLLPVLAVFGTSFAYTIKALFLETLAEAAALKNLSMAVNILAAAGDILITLSMVSLLRRTRTGLRRADAMANKLIAYSLNTGLLTSICAILSLVTITALPTTLVYTCFYFILGRVYTNSLLATLNDRRLLQRAVPAGSSVSASMNLTYIFSSSLK
ncbi:hypothetical protein DFH11DRAFT_1306223 [Phellopilus nigrolimitatus]|nr:hypothetical protein DFH11DRAFT_1306223 [Phellopilus nigrolimitatus]